MNPYLAKVMALATANIGVREIGRTNTGALVSAWQRKTGIDDGNPWCACFVYSMFEDASIALGCKNPFPRTAWTPDIESWARKNGILLRGDKARPQAGNVFLVKGPSRVYHTGFVRSVQGNSWTSIEGNSNSDGSREGYEVASNSGKPFAARYLWVRVADLPSLGAGASTQRESAPQNAAARTVPIVFGGKEIARAALDTDNRALFTADTLRALGHTVVYNAKDHCIEVTS